MYHYFVEIDLIVILILNIGFNTIKICYGDYFNANDKYNHFLHKRYYPYISRAGWQCNYDFIFAAYQMNLYTLYHEMNSLEARMSNKGFSELLRRKIIDEIVLREKRDYWKQTKFE